MTHEHGSHHESPDPADVLHPVDARVLDRMVEVGFDADALEGLTEEEQARAGALLSAFHLLDDYPIGDEPGESEDDVLIHATLARVARAEDAAAERRRIINHHSAEDSRRGFRIRMPDLVSVAALILIGISVMWPIMGEIRNRSIDAGCVANLASLNTAFSGYAAGWNGRVPLISTDRFGASSDGPQWLDLRQLAVLGYCEHGHIHCPGHPSTAAAGYSRQLLGVGQSIRWLTGGTRPVVADLNPMIDSVEYVDPRMNSSNHGKRGQNLLNMDGSVTWLEVPIVDSDDNIWLIRGQNHFNPALLPDSERDIYLVQ